MKSAFVLEKNRDKMIKLNNKDKIIIRRVKNITGKKTMMLHQNAVYLPILL